MHALNSGALGGAGPEAAAGPRIRLTDIVHDQIFRLIMRGDFPKNCKLPPEGELCTRFGVSRPILREALSRLRDQGYVRSQRGSGTVVLRGEAPSPSHFPAIRSIADLLRSYEFRISVETATVAIAAERRSNPALADIEATLASAEVTLDSRAFHLMADLNFAFHRSVARATQNPFYLATLEMMPNFVGIDRLNTSTFGEEDMGERLARIHSEHQSILEAIRRRDVKTAQGEMERHIAAARDYVLERQSFSLGKVAKIID